MANNHLIVWPVYAEDGKQIMLPYADPASKEANPPLSFYEIPYEENPESAIIRRMREELSVNVRSTAIHFVATHVDETTSTIYEVYQITSNYEDMLNDDAGESAPEPEGLTFFEAIEYRLNTPEVKAALLTIMNCDGLDRLKMLNTDELKDKLSQARITPPTQEILARYPALMPR